MNIAEPRPAARVNLSLRMASLTAGALIALLLACSCVAPIAAHAASGGKVSSTATAKSGGGEGGGVTDLENAAKNAGKTGEKRVLGAHDRRHDLHQRTPARLAMLDD